MKSIFTFLRSCSGCGKIFGDTTCLCIGCEEQLNAFRSDGELAELENGIQLSSLYIWKSDPEKILTEYLYSLKGGGLKEEYQKLSRQFRKNHCTGVNPIFIPVPSLRPAKKDHALSLAMALAEEWKGAFLDCLAMCDGVQQKRLCRSKRLQRKIKIKTPKVHEYLKEKQIILVDDICTTGGTINACRRVLFRNKKIQAWVVARRPLRKGVFR